MKKTYLKKISNRTKKASDGHKMYEYQCICGTIKFIQNRAVEQGDIKSCGCMRYKLIGNASITHGLTKHPLYNVHRAMISRCCNKKDAGYKYYGKKGIKIYKKWFDVKKFIKDMYPTYKSGLMIDRIDSEKGYYPHNCKWSTSIEQNRNRSSNIKYNGECARTASLRLNGNKSLVKDRIKLGWSKEKAFTVKPLRKNYAKNQYKTR